MPRTALAADPRVKRHDAGSGHPEQPARFSAVMDRIESSGLRTRMLPIQARSATDEELSLAHTETYIGLVEREVAQNRRQLSTGDTAISAHSTEAARSAVGCALSAVDAVFTGAAQNAFCVVRPPGHHAS